MEVLNKVLHHGIYYKPLQIATIAANVLLAELI